MGRYLNDYGSPIHVGRSWKFIGICLALSSLLAGCATAGGQLSVANDRQTKTENKYAVPSNYRQLIARDLTQLDAAPLARATISQPAEVFMGFANGGMRPVICAATVKEGGLIPTATRWIFMFEDGRISDRVANPGAIYCANIAESPFPEAQRPSR